MYIADSHADTLSKLLLFSDGANSLTQSYPEHHIDLPRAKQAQLKLQIFSIFTEDFEIAHYGAVRALQMMQVYKDDIRRHPDQFELITKASQMDAIATSDKFFGIFSMEGASPLCGDLKMLEVFYTMGLRAIGLTWNHRNELADGVGVGSNYGLTPFGRDVIRRMNELGMVVDLAHINEAGYWEALELSQSPVIVSHANAKALCPHRRNLNDAQLDALKEQGGYIGVCFAGGFLVEDPQKASLEDLVRHIDYLCERIGPDHVALGSDFDGIRHPPKNLEEVSQFPNLFTALEKLGYKEEDLNKIAYQNIERIYKQVLKG